MTDLRIGTIMLSGGGALGVAPFEAAIDRATLAAWAPDTVLTLLEPGPRADAVGATCAELGITWHHQPIHDFAVPDVAFESCWHTVGTALRAQLQGGGRLLVHCWAGRGRSGTIAARLLVELGEADADAAIASVRAARPGAIETAAQEDHVRAQRMVK